MVCLVDSNDLAVSVTFFLRLCPPKAFSKATSSRPIAKAG